MKTLQELYNEIMANDELKKGFAAAAQSKDTLVAFAKEHGVETTMDEITVFLEASKAQEEELAPEEMENAAGGACSDKTLIETLTSTISFGVACVVEVCVSAAGGRVGKEKKKDGRLCNDF